MLHRSTTRSSTQNEYSAHNGATCATRTGSPVQTRAEGYARIDYRAKGRAVALVNSLGPGATNA